jgi:hypothetical protein
VIRLRAVNGTCVRADVGGMCWIVEMERGCWSDL